MGTSKRYVKLNRFANITVCKCQCQELEIHIIVMICPTDDHNRITLNPLEDYVDHQGEFVNACYIDVSCQNNITSKIN